MGAVKCEMCEQWACDSRDRRRYAGSRLCSTCAPVFLARYCQRLEDRIQRLENKAGVRPRPEETT